MEVSNLLGSWLIAYLREWQTTDIGATIHVPSTMNIPVHTWFQKWGHLEYQKKVQVCDYAVKSL